MGIFRFVAGEIQSQSCFVELRPCAWRRCDLWQATCRAFSMKKTCAVKLFLFVGLFGQCFCWNLWKDLNFIPRQNARKKHGPWSCIRVASDLQLCAKCANHKRIYLSIYLSTMELDETTCFEAVSCEAKPSQSKIYDLQRPTGIQYGIELSLVHSGTPFYWKVSTASQGLTRTKTIT